LLIRNSLQHDNEAFIEVDRRIAHLVKEDLLKLGMHEEK